MTLLSSAQQMLVLHGSWRPRRCSFVPDTDRMQHVPTPIVGGQSLELVGHLETAAVGLLCSATHVAPLAQPLALA